MNNKTILTSCLLMMLMVFIMTSCSKMEDPIAEYVKNGEIIYATRVDSLKAIGGRERIKITWMLPPNKTAVKTIIQWNGGQKSKEITLTASATGKYEGILDNMAEGAYLFKIFTEDSQGNKSVGLSLTGSAYGTNYQNSILNRAINSTVVNRDSVVLNWGAADLGNVATELRYTGSDQTIRTLRVKPTELRTVIRNAKVGTYISIQGLYLPEPLSADTFRVSKTDMVLIDVLPGVYRAIGNRYNYNADGTYASTTPFDIEKQLEKTATPGTYVFDDVANLANFADTKVFLKLNADNTIEVSGFVSVAGVVENHPTAGKSFYDPVSGSFTLRYKYTNTNGTVRLIEETWAVK